MKSIKLNLFFILLILGGYAVSAPIAINLQDPNLFQEMAIAERDYKDCNQSNSAFTCPAGSPAGYSCQQVRAEDIFEDNEENIIPVRRFILGHDPGQAEAGKAAGTTCSEERPGFLPSIIASITLYDQNQTPIAPTVDYSQPTPQTDHPKIFHPDMSLHTLSLGCESNKCLKNNSLPVPVPGTPDYNRFSQYQCQPRMICRCMEEGESLNTQGASCCEGLVSVNGLCGVDPQIIAAQTDAALFLPDHVNGDTGTFDFLKDPQNPDEESPALVALFHNIIQMKALEWFAHNQQTTQDDSIKCLPDSDALKKIGVEMITQKMKEITTKYNEDMAKLQDLKSKYIQYSQQIRDPKAFFRQQGTISYRGRTMTQAEFEAFVRNSTSGAEIFNLMADEQKLQLTYEYKVAELLNILSDDTSTGPFQKIRDGFAGVSPGDKGIGNIFGVEFECRITGFLGFRRKLKNRWRSQYRVNSFSPENFVSFRRPDTDDNMVFFEGFMNRTVLGQKIFHKGKTGQYFRLTEPLMATGGEKRYHDFGHHRSTMWSNRQPHSLSGTKSLESIKDFYRDNIYKYFKEQYYDEGHEIIDVAFGGLRVCIDSSEDVPFSINSAQACQRYQKAMDYVVEAGFGLFLQASYGGRKYNGWTLNSKSDFYLGQQQSAATLLGLYDKLSDIPTSFGGLAFLDQTGIDFQAKFEQINDNPNFPGFLRLKSYLFFRARASLLASGTPPGGLATGNVPDLGNIYGTPATMLNSMQRPETTVENLQTRTAQLRESNNLATQAARDARNREDFLAINGRNGAGSIASSRGDRRIAKLNEKANKYIKDNPKAASSIAKAQALAASANKKISSAISSTLAKPATGALPASNNIQKLSDKKEKEEETTKKLASSTQEAYAPDISGLNNGSIYTEKTAQGSSGANNGQLTSLSDYELGKAVENVENQPHLFKTDEDDSLFSKISKTYARSYNRFLVKKHKNSTKRTMLKSKKKIKVEKLLNDI